MTNLIELKNLSKYYLINKKIYILKKINFKFKKGFIYSLVGPSGSGKSTLLNLISLVDKPSSGEIIIDKNIISKNSNEKNDEIRAKKIGIIYQQNNLLNDFTAFENVCLAKLAVENNKEKAISESNKIIKKFGLSNRLNHFPAELSGGEMQRIAISRALVNKPSIILADEPTGSLDHTTSKQVFKILHNLRSPDRIIIYATHNRLFANMADCKLEIIDGNIKPSNERKYQKFL